MSLMDKVAGVARRSSRSARLYGAGSLALAAGLLYSGNARAATINVDPSWMGPNNDDPVLVNNILDGNPATLGLGGQMDAQSGDTIHFAPGNYQLGLGKGYFRVYVDNVNVEGSGIDSTVFKGESIDSGLPVWKVFSKNNQLTDFNTESSYTGIYLDGQNYDNISIMRVRSKGHNKHYVYDQQQAGSITVQANIKFDGCLIEDGTTGVNFNKLTARNANTKYAGIKNSTMRRLQGVGTDAPFYMDNNVIVVKGNDEFNNNVYESGVESFLENLYPGFQTPSGYVEAGNVNPSLAAGPIGIDPITHQPINMPPIQPTSGPLNMETTVAGLLLDANGRPQVGSPLISPKYPRGYAGALPPYEGFVSADTNGDGRVDGTDLAAFMACRSGAGIPKDDRNCNSFDKDNDGDVDMDDFGRFQRCISGNTPVNPNCDQ